MKTGKIILISAVFLIAFGLVLGSQTSVLAQDSKLVKLHAVGDEKLAGIFIDPADAYVKKDTIVIWLSGIKDQEVKIEFADGKKCKSVTAHAVNFDLDKERWCYVTSFVPFAATSSLQFTDVGEYVYKVYTKEGIKATGRIVVE